MKKLQILGTGCPSCRTLAERTEEAAATLGIACEVEKVTDMSEILTFDAPSTPALVVDGEVKLAGRVPSVEEIKTLLQ